jgi:hypothetical protein
MTDNGKRNWLLVLPIAGLGIGYLLLLGYILWNSALGLGQSDMVASPTPMPKRVDLWDAYEKACTVAQPHDGQLVSASTQWQAADEGTLLDGTTTWSFVFYSPVSGESLDVVVNAGAARIVNRVRAWVAPSTMAEGNWLSDPQDALLTFLAYGGRMFLDEHPRAVVDMHLGGSNDGTPVWTIAALDYEDRSLLSLSIHAETGRVLSETPQYARR